MSGRVQQPAAITPGSMSELAQKSVVQSVPTQQQISGHPEQGPIQSGPAQAEDNEDDVVQPARQEVSVQPAGPQTAEVGEIEVTPSIPEVSVEKSVEHVVEKSPDMDKPKLPEAVKAAGVTHSGPGIPVDENVFNIKTMPMTYEDAKLEEKQHPKLNDSKHWLAELIMYVWRKLDPDINKKKEVKK